MSYLIIIPARMESTRLPNKPLIDILGKTLIQRTYEQVLKVVPNNKILVATDSLEIKNHLEGLGYNAELTSTDCLTGTDRVAEIANRYDHDYYINVQGDEPLINPQDIKVLLDRLDTAEGKILNGYTSIVDEADFRSISIPKVVFRPDGRLLFMSRSAIPGNKKNILIKSWRQVCIYAFPKKALFEFQNQKEKTCLEEMEDIEILRFLEMGYDVQMIEMSDESIAVDNPEDVQKVIDRINGN